MNPQKYRTTTATIRLLAPNLAEAFIHDSTKLEVDDLLEMKRINKELTREQPYSVLIVPGANTTITKKGRHLLASAEYQQQTLAVAIIKRSPLIGIIFNFYVKLNKPKTKIQIFSKRDDAIDWLKKQG